MGLIENLERRLAAGHDDKLLRFGLGSAYASGGDYAAAETHLTVCINIDPDYSAAYKALGKALVKFGKLDAAEDIFRQGLDAASRSNDKQTIREIEVALKKLNKRNPAEK